MDGRGGIGLAATVAGLLLALSGAPESRATPPPPPPPELTLLEVAAADERGDAATLRRALKDPALLRRVGAAGQGIEFRLAIARSSVSDLALREDGFEAALAEIRGESRRVRGAMAMRARADLAQRQFEVLIEFAEFKRYRLIQDLFNLPGARPETRAYIVALGADRWETQSVYSQAVALFGDCPSDECADQREALWAEAQAAGREPAAEVVSQLNRAVDLEDEAYELYGVERRYPGYRAYEASARTFREAAARYRLAGGVLAGAYPRATAAKASIEALARRAETRASYSDQRARERGGDTDPPPLPAGAAPAPAPEPAGPEIVSNPDLSVLALQAAGESRALTKYQKDCRPVERDGRIEPFKASSVLEIPFATTRQPFARQNAAKERFYSAEREAVDAAGLRVRYGVAPVNVPCDRPPGTVKRPLTVFSIQLEPTNDDKHFVLKQTRELPDRAAWLADIDDRLDGSRQREVLLYVHGFNNSFAAASYRAAQLHADLGIDGATVFYSWASSGNLLRYDKDLTYAQSEEEAQALAGVLRALRQGGARRVYLVAHSMGNRLMTRALERIARDQTSPVAKFDELVMGSADLPKSRMSVLLPSLTKQVKRTTLYASRSDLAMAAAKLFYNDEQRLGDASPRPLVFPPIETIDTSEVRGEGLGHDDFAGPGLGDLRAVLWMGLGPGRRCILQSLVNPGELNPYWQILPQGGQRCGHTSFGDALQLTRLYGSTGSAGQWLTDASAARPELLTGDNRQYLDGVRTVLGALGP